MELVANYGSCRASKIIHVVDCQRYHDSTYMEELHLDSELIALSTTAPP